MPKRNRITIPYGDHAEQYAQLSKPMHDNKLPVVIVIHGGYWKDNHDLNTYPTHSLVKYLETLDVAVWNLEYRRMNFTGENKSAPWPATFQDVAQGIDFLKTIDELHHLNLEQILLIGHSAGGHLATWVGSRHVIPRSSELYCPQPLTIQSIISIAGILNLRGYPDVEQPQQILRLMGGTYERFPERYHACDPNLLPTSTINLTIMHSEKDSCVTINQAKVYCQNSPACIQTIYLAQGEHFSMLPFEGEWLMEQWTQLKQLVVQKIVSLTLPHKTCKTELPEIHRNLL
tara:strand:- start:107405 stop:108268 length:864 start_codon:yes stop_codon:yes gene_type:complete